MNTSGAKRSEYLVRREAAEVAKAAERSGVPKPADAADGGEAKCSALELLPHCSTFAERQAKHWEFAAGVERHGTERSRGANLETIFAVVRKRYWTFYPRYT